MMHSTAPRQYSIRGKDTIAAASHHHLARRRPLLARASAQAKARVVAAFRALAKGADAPIAHARMKTFFRSGGMDWARSLV